MTELSDFRAAKDAFFRDSEASPLRPEQQRVFGGLRYYPENPAFRLALEPEVFDDPQVVDMQTSTGDEAHYIRWAAVEFEVDGSHQRLTLFRDPGEGGLFLPFQDAGRGTETYGAGRYLEPELSPDGSVLVDFNYAYNPYCAYNDAWSCPLPPAENRLNVAIRAGEMLFHSED